MDEPAWIQIWEQGQHQGAVGRALTVLSLLRPEASRDEFARLPIGERQALLLELQERAFGGHIEGDGTCPRCGSAVEYAFRTADVRIPGGDRPAQVLEHGGYRVAFRLVTSEDLLALAGFTDPTAARRHLAERCIVEATQQRERVDVAALPEAVIGALSDRMEACDPQAETRLALQCPDCGARWRESFEIAEHLWGSVTRAARDLMVQVHRLALHYHWSEDQILALSPERRAYYLQLVGA